MKIIDERDERLAYRRLQKKKYDEIITLGVQSSGEKIRLLDEGMVTYADGTPWFYIKKGAIKRFYERLSDDYVGSVKAGHIDLGNFPDRIIGDWTKEDLTLVELENGRYALDAELRLNEQHPIVQALRVLPFDLGASVEMNCYPDDSASEALGIPVYEDIEIFDYAIVGDPANVNSTFELKGENMGIKELLEKEGATKDLSSLNDAIDKLLKLSSEEETVEETSEEVEATVEETEEETSEEKTAEEVEVKEVEASAEDETEETSEGESEDVLDLGAVASMIDDLSKRIEALESENDTLRANLKAKEDAEDEFIKKFKKLGVSLSTEREKPEVKNEVVFTDGFGG